MISEIKLFAQALVSSYSVKGRKLWMMLLSSAKMIGVFKTWLMFGLLSYPLVRIKFTRSLNSWENVFGRGRLLTFCSILLIYGTSYGVTPVIISNNMHPIAHMSKDQWAFIMRNYSSEEYGGVFAFIVEVVTTPSTIFEIPKSVKTKTFWSPTFLTRMLGGFMSLWITRFLWT